MKVYVCYDKVADKFTDPFMAVNDKSAIRICHRNFPPEWVDDFILYFLCEFPDPAYIKRADLVGKEIHL